MPVRPVDQQACGAPQGKLSICTQSQPQRRQAEQFLGEHFLVALRARAEPCRMPPGVPGVDCDLAAIVDDPMGRPRSSNSVQLSNGGL